MMSGTEGHVLRQPATLFNDVSASSTGFEDSPSKTGGGKTNVRFFDLSTIVGATNNFSNANKLGQGGFGSVYKVFSAAYHLINNKNESRNDVLLIANILIL